MVMLALVLSLVVVVVVVVVVGQILALELVVLALVLALVLGLALLGVELVVEGMAAMQGSLEVEQPRVVLLLGLLRQRQLHPAQLHPGRSLQLFRAGSARALGTAVVATPTAATLPRPQQLHAACVLVSVVWWPGKASTNADVPVQQAAELSRARRSALRPRHT